MSEQLFIGLTGDPGSGKSTAAEYLHTAHGFAEFAGSTYLKKLATEYGVELRRRADYNAFQRRLRLERSKSFVADATLEMTEPRVMNVGIRNKWDVQKLQKSGGLIIALTCPLEVRFERVAGTDEKYPVTLEEFVAAEAPEYNDPDPYGQHTHWAMDHADYVIDSSSGSLAEVRRILDDIVIAHS